MIKNLLLAIITFTTVGLAALPTASLAFSPYEGVKCAGKVSNSAVCSTAKPTNNPISGNHGLLNKITNIVAFAAGGAAIIILLVGSIRFITSGGDANKVASARSAITNALIGLAIIVLARAIINYVIGRL